MHINQTIPTSQELVSEIRNMLDIHGYHKAIFMGHSLGTCVVNWAVQNMPERVAGVTLLDPVVFLLHYSDLAYNFVHRAPTTPNEVWFLDIKNFGHAKS
jgi:pimeloyl-ACP methyl ester carboxylesterase